MTLQLAAVRQDLGDIGESDRDAYLLFAESNTRFLCEVPPSEGARFEQALGDVPHALVGEVCVDARLRIAGTDAAATLVIDAELADLKKAWQEPLRW